MVVPLVLCWLFFIYQKAAEQIQYVQGVCTVQYHPVQFKGPAINTTFYDAYHVSFLLPLCQRVVDLTLYNLLLGCIVIVALECVLYYFIHKWWIIMQSDTTTALIQDSKINSVFFFLFCDTELNNLVLDLVRRNKPFKYVTLGL